MFAYESFALDDTMDNNTLLFNFFRVVIHSYSIIVNNKS